MKYRSNKKQIMKHYAVLALVIGGGSWAAEVNPAANIYTPIVHQKYYQGEREQLGYQPAYYPGIFSFDDRNQPYVRTPAGTVQTLDEQSRWIELDFKPTIKKAFPDWNGELDTGPFAAEEIAFDRDGVMYTLVTLLRKSGGGQVILLTSADHGQNWQAASFPARLNNFNAKLEIAGPWRRGNKPPSVTFFNGKELYLALPEKSKSGIVVPPPILISREAIQAPTHSGGGNISVTASDKTFIVYAGKEQPPGTEGTPQYTVAVDHFSGMPSAPVYLGSNGHGGVDGHNLPSIVIDSKGILHVLQGSHHNPFKYLRSVKPYDISEWTSPEILGYPKTKCGEGSYTYIGLLVDAFDNLHLTARWAGMGYKNYLIYMRKPAGRDWRPQKILVEPFKTLYSVWYHKMAQDRFGRIFINYSYFGSELTSEQWAAYKKKYQPQTDGKQPPDNYAEFLNGIWVPGVRAQDPVTLVSNDSGESFRLALTDDFVGGITGDTASGSTTTNSIGMQLVEIPAGSFMMGSLNQNFYDEKPLRPTTISKPFQIGRHEVRVKDFAKFVEATNYKTVLERRPPEQVYSWRGGKMSDADQNSTWRSPGIPQTPDHPVTLLTVDDAKAFCRWLSKKEKATYRLPTEAEWEYAGRANTITPYYFGDSAELLPRYGWYKSNATGTKPAGLLLPNAWGLYDMAGNVWEFCSDYYLPTKSDLPAVDPVQTEDQTFGPVIRGGSWIDDWEGGGNGENLRSSARYHVYYPLIQLDWVGFRVVKEID